LVNKKDYSGVDKIQGNLVYINLPSFIFYMNIIAVPEPYSIAHQNLLSAYENFYNLIKDTQYQQINDEYLEKLKGGYEDIKKASEEWELVLEKQS
jgi:tyrosine-protein phosphatase YwqE